MFLRSAGLRRATVVLAAGLASVGGLAAFAGPSSADVNTATVVAASVKTVLQGQPSQAAGNWTVTIPTSVSAGSVVNLTANPFGLLDSTVNCSGGNYIEFAGTPTVTVTAVGATPTTAVPAVTATLDADGTQSACSTLHIFNNLGLLFTTPGTLPSGDTGWSVAITGITYTVGASAATGPVTTIGSSDTTGASVTTSLSVPSNAAVSSASVTADSPRSGLLQGDDTNQPISPVVVTESAAGGLPNGYVCVELNVSDPATFDTATGSVPTITTTATTSNVGTSVTSPNSKTLAFDVTGPSAAAETYTLGNLHVTGNSSLGPDQVVVLDGENSTCSASPVAILNSNLQVFTELTSTRTAGSDADATAIDEFGAEFPAANCGTEGYPTSVVLATDQGFPDALSASYLEGNLNTGLFLTPTAALSSETARAIAVYGIKTVYVVGGPLAVSPAVISALQALPVYQCGGTALASPAATVSVIQISSGATQYDTSQLIANYFLKSGVGSAAFPGAYGSYDDTTGQSSTSAASGTTPVPTAIVASGVGFQDATASSVIAYKDHFPVVLTTPTALASQAQASLTNLGIKQVILVGGPLAVSDSVVSQIQALGISVLRIAGIDATDTATQLAEFELNSGTVTNVGAAGLGWDTASDNQVIVARGDFYSDGLAGAGFAATAANGHPEPILLTEDPNTVGQYLQAFLETGGSPAGFTFDTAGARINTINVLGGTLALTPTTLDNILEDVITG